MVYFAQMDLIIRGDVVEGAQQLLTCIVVIVLFSGKNY